MNINDYVGSPLNSEKQTRVEYVRDDFGLESRYPVQSYVSIKGRRDLMGKIDRFEDGKIIVKIFNEVYSVPPQDFDSIFFMHPKEELGWYRKTKNKG